MRGGLRARWYAAITQMYELMLQYQNWQDAGRLIVPGLSGVGDIDGTDALAQAEALGKHFWKSEPGLVP